MSEKIPVIDNYYYPLWSPRKPSEFHVFVEATLRGDSLPDSRRVILAATTERLSIKADLRGKTRGIF